MAFRRGHFLFTICGLYKDKCYPSLKIKCLIIHRISMSSVKGKTSVSFGTFSFFKKKKIFAGFRAFPISSGTNMDFKLNSI